MKICSPQLGISSNSILGGEIYDRQILKHLTLLGVEAEIILPRHKPYEAMCGWKVTNIPLPFVFPPHLYNAYVLPYLFSIYNKRPFDLLRIHSPTFIGLAAAVFKRKFPSVPVVGVYHWLGEGGFVESLLDPYLLRIFDGIICDSEATRRQIIGKYSISSAKIHTIYNGVDEILAPGNKSRKILDMYSVPIQSRILLFMGLFIERKNPLFLVEIMPKILTKFPDIVLFLCGSGPLETMLCKKISALSLETKIKIIKPVYGKEKKALFNTVDIFVHPALKEGFSLAVVEAMAAGLPVIITDGFSAAEAITHKKNGFLCKTEVDWLMSLTYLFKNKSVLQTISQNNVDKVAKYFTWSIAAKKHLKLFQSLIAH